MTPGARVAAAIEILDSVLAGTPAEQALTRWARSHRFAGSGDRAAIRDHVYDAVRRRRSAAALGGAETGRGLMIGVLRYDGIDPGGLFNGVGYAPPRLSADEHQVPLDPDEETALDCPAPLAHLLRQSLGANFAAVLAQQQSRASVFLRVNAHRCDRTQAAEALAAEGIETRPHTLSRTALEVVGNTRKIRTSQAFREGLVEVQDAASQAVADLVPVTRHGRVLDYCAGGGGKALALAARGATVVAHDVAPARMSDLPARAGRAMLEDRISTDWNQSETFKTVLIDVPCSGSGAWRRAPDAKWRFGLADLAQLVGLQREILDATASFVADGGTLAYVTCSILDDENHNQINAFLADQPNWQCDTLRSISPLEGGDGFFIALLTRKSA